MNCVRGGQVIALTCGPIASFEVTLRTFDPFQKRGYLALANVARTIDSCERLIRKARKAGCMGQAR